MSEKFLSRHAITIDFVARLAVVVAIAACVAASIVVVLR